MDKNFIKFLSFFILSSKKRKIFRSKFINKQENFLFVQTNLAIKYGYKNCFIDPSSQIYLYNKDKKNLIMSENCWIGGNCVIAAGIAKIKFGHNVIIAGRSVLLTNSHNYRADTCLPYDRGNVSRPIEIEDCVWVGMGATILGGVKIEKGAIVGAGSVVTKSVPQCAIVAGNPAKIVGWRNKEIFYKLYNTNAFEEINKINYDDDYEILVNKFNPYLSGASFSQNPCGSRERNSAEPQK